MSDEELPPFERRLGNAPVSNDVLAYQMGVLKESLDRGLGAMERAMEKGLEHIASEVKELNGRVSSIERRQEYDAARLKSLEEFRQEQDNQSERRRLKVEAERDAAVDDSRLLKGGRALGAFVIAALGLALTVLLIIAAINGANP